MVNQTEYVDSLRERMHKSFEEGYYFESIVCSYAIIENRTQKICNHIGINCNPRESLDAKTNYIYSGVKDLNTQTDRNIQKILAFLKYHLEKQKWVKVDTSKSYKDICDDLKNDFTLEESNKLIVFRKQRNELTHKLYNYDSSNPKLLDVNEYKPLAEMGRDIAVSICRLASNIKSKYIVI